MNKDLTQIKIALSFFKDAGVNVELKGVGSYTKIYINEELVGTYLGENLIASVITGMWCGYAVGRRRK